MLFSVLYMVTGPVEWLSRVALTHQPMLVRAIPADAVDCPWYQVSRITMSPVVNAPDTAVSSHFTAEKVRLLMWSMVLKNTSMPPYVIDLNYIRFKMTFM